MPLKAVLANKTFQKYIKGIALYAGIVSPLMTFYAAGVPADKLADDPAWFIAACELAKSQPYTHMFLYFITLLVILGAITAIGVDRALKTN